MNDFILLNHRNCEEGSAAKELARLIAADADIPLGEIKEIRQGEGNVWSITQYLTDNDGLRYCYPETNTAAHRIRYVEFEMPEAFGSYYSIQRSIDSPGAGSIR